MGATSGAGPADPSGAPEFARFFCGVRATLSFVSRVCFVDRCLFFSLLVVVLSVLLRFTDPDYPFGIFKLFFRRELTYTCYSFFFLFLFFQQQYYFIQMLVTISFIRPSFS
jgi:hypothetical protein